MFRAGYDVLEKDLQKASVKDVKGMLSRYEQIAFVNKRSSMKTKVVTMQPLAYVPSDKTTRKTGTKDYPILVQKLYLCHSWARRKLIILAFKNLLS